MRYSEIKAILRTLQHYGYEKAVHGHYEKRYYLGPLRYRRALHISQAIHYRGDLVHMLDHLDKIAIRKMQREAEKRGLRYEPRL